MEDRYLFRAKRTDTGEWIIGSLLVDKQQDIETGEQIEIIGIYPSEYNDFAKKVDPSTICQCTGFRDKNGELIWEKDILMAYLDEDHPEDVTYAKIEWNGSGWITHENNNEDQEYLDDFVLENYEVVGNIFDNPGLLEV